MCVTLGSLLQRLERGKDTDERFSFFMPTANGPCRFGVYNLLHKIVLERLGWKDRVRIWSPEDTDYFEGIPAGFSALVFSGFMVIDLLQEMLYHVRPVERRPGDAQRIYDQYRTEILQLLEQEGGGDLALPTALLQVASGRLFGCTDLLRRAATEMLATRSDRRLPEVLVVGEIYVRCDAFSNDFVVEKLERRGIRARFAPFNEWLEYTDHLKLKDGRRLAFGDQLTSIVQTRMQNLCYGAVADVLGWPPRTTVKDSLAASQGYIRGDLHGEAILTVGGPVHEWRQGVIDGVVSVGPLECMPNKISEAQFAHIGEDRGLISLTLPMTGDPVDPELLDRFAFEVKERFAHRKDKPAPHAAGFRLRDLRHTALLGSLKMLSPFAVRQ